MEGGGRAGDASDGDEFEGARQGASRHADQHVQLLVSLSGAFPVIAGSRIDRLDIWGCASRRPS